MTRRHVAPSSTVLNLSGKKFCCPGLYCKEKRGRAGLKSPLAGGKKPKTVKRITDKSGGEGVEETPEMSPPAKKLVLLGGTREDEETQGGGLEAEKPMFELPLKVCGMWLEGLNSQIMQASCYNYIPSWPVESVIAATRKPTFCV